MVSKITREIQTHFVAELLALETSARKEVYQAIEDLYMFLESYFKIIGNEISYIDTYVAVRAEIDRERNKLLEGKKRKPPEEEEEDDDDEEEEEKEKPPPLPFYKRVINMYIEKRDAIKLLKSQLQDGMDRTQEIKDDLKERGEKITKPLWYDARTHYFIAWASKTDIAELNDAFQTHLDCYRDLQGVLSRTLQKSAYITLYNPQPLKHVSFISFYKRVEALSMHPDLISIAPLTREVLEKTCVSIDESLEAYRVVAKKFHVLWFDNKLFYDQISVWFKTKYAKYRIRKLIATLDKTHRTFEKEMDDTLDQLKNYVH